MNGCSDNSDICRSMARGVLLVRLLRIRLAILRVRWVLLIGRRGVLRGWLLVAWIRSRGSRRVRLIVWLATRWWVLVRLLRVRLVVLRRICALWRRILGGILGRVLGVRV